MHEEHDMVIGTRSVWGGEEPFVLRRADRRLHTYVIGKTGTGKTTLLRNMVLQDIYAGNGVAVIDPHGDMAESLIDQIPPRRTEDVVYFDATDREFPIGLNLLQHVEPEQRHVVASGIVAAFKSIWRDSWGPRLEYVFYAAVAALLECEHVTLLGVQRMLAEEEYRNWVLRQVEDPIVRRFWDHEFSQYDKRFRTEVIAPVQNKVGQLLMAPAIRNIFGQMKSKINFRSIMDRRGIFIANLSKGKLGEDKSNLLGSLLITQYQLAAMSRADVPEDTREDYSLFVDEFQNFATDSFASILSEARKYRLALVLSHQMMDQLGEANRSAVLGNVGTIISFRVGEADATILAREFGRTYQPQTFCDLANHEICVRLLAGGQISNPFVGRSLAPIRLKTGRRDVVVGKSREQYASDRLSIEGKIERWLR